VTDPVISIVNRGNQRGGRALSVVDLIDAGTLSRRQTAWLLDRILDGSSWLVGAKPGGAGKTTIMSALLAMIPAPRAIRAAAPGTGWEKSAPGDCVVAYEVSAGPYDGYVWGEDVRRLTELGLAGCRIVSNLHADTLEQARSQIVDECGASEKGLAACGIFLPIALSGVDWGAHRSVERLFYSVNGVWQVIEDEPRLDARAKEIALLLTECQRRKLCTCEDVRLAWLEWLGHNS
jgi:hypothetical protein